MSGRLRRHWNRTGDATHHEVGHTLAMLKQNVGSDRSGIVSSVRKQTDRHNVAVTEFCSDATEPTPERAGRGSNGLLVTRCLWIEHAEARGILLWQRGQDAHRHIGHVESREILAAVLHNQPEPLKISNPIPKVR